MNAGQRRIFAIIAASSGNLVEWFDFYVYSYCAIYFASSFFPASDPTTQLLNAAGIFAAGFLMRPLGAWFLGRLADRQGRRLAMMVAVLMMCGGSLLIACLPTYSQIGKAAPALLLVARLLQGLSVGGEYGVSATYLSEVGTQDRRGFYASFQYVTLIGGQLLALLVIVILQHILPDTELKAWGWRIPFIIGAFAALIALWLRRSLSETTSKEVRTHSQAGTLQGLFRHKRSILTVLGFTACGSLTFYTFTTYMQKYLINTTGMAPKTASVLMMSALSVCLFLNPIFGALSDKIGRRAMMIIYSVLTMLCTVPIMYTLKGTTNPYIAFGLVMSALTILTLYTSVGGLLKAELFPTEVRALGVGLAYALANAAFGGSAEYVALKLKSLGVESSFYWYVTALALMCLLISLNMPDLRRHGYLKGE